MSTKSKNWEILSGPTLYHCSWCYPMQCQVHWSRTPQLSRDSHSHSVARVPPAPLTGEDPRNHTADKWNRQPAIFLSNPQYTSLGLLLGPYRWIPAAPIYSCYSQGYKPLVYPQHSKAQHGITRQWSPTTRPTTIRLPEYWQNYNISIPAYLKGLILGGIITRNM